jgi:hypothetical protein
LSVRMFPIKMFSISTLNLRELEGPAPLQRLRLEPHGSAGDLAELGRGQKRRLHRDLGYGDNIHIIVVSRKFDGMREKEKQELLWRAIDESDLSDAEKVLISLILPYSPGDLK